MNCTKCYHFKMRLHSDFPHLLKICRVLAVSHGIILLFIFCIMVIMALKNNYAKETEGNVTYIKGLLV